MPSPMPPPAEAHQRELHVAHTFLKVSAHVLTHGFLQKHTALPSFQARTCPPSTATFCGRSCSIPRLTRTLLTTTCKRAGGRDHRDPILPGELAHETRT